MARIEELYKGEFKTCPRCKGHKYIRGQKTDINGRQLPNYKKVQSGICFLCDGSGKAFFTQDNRVLKCKNTKIGGVCVVEFDAKTGNKISYEYLSENSKSKKYITASPSFISTGTSLDYLDKESMFPTIYEMIWSDWSKVVDVIFEEYPNSAAISADRINIDDSGTFFNFLFYFDKDGRYIEPFYKRPQYSDEDDSYKGIVLLGNSYVGVSGTYMESERTLSIGFNMKRAIDGKEGYLYLYFENIDTNVNIDEVKVTTFKENSSINYDTKFIIRYAKGVLYQLYRLMGEVNADLSVDEGIIADKKIMST